VAERTALSVLVENKPGVLARVSGLFSRRGFNISSLAVGTTEVPGRSRMTIVIDADTRLEQVTKQLNKLINVLKVTEFYPDDTVERELQLVKVGVGAARRAEIFSLCDVFRAQIVDVSDETVVVESTGSPEKNASLVDLLEPYGIRELVRSGSVALSRGGRGMDQASGAQLHRIA